MCIELLAIAFVLFCVGTLLNSGVILSFGVFALMFAVIALFDTNSFTAQPKPYMPPRKP